MFVRIQSLLATAALAAVGLGVAGCGSRIPEQRPVDLARMKIIREGLVAAGAEAGQPSETAQAQPTGWGTLRGTFRFPAGALASLPKPAPLEIGGDDAVYCGKMGVPTSETLLFDAATAGIQNVVIFLGDDLAKKTDASVWIHPTAAPGKNDPVIFDQKNCVFLSHVLAMQVSQPLEIKNSDEVGHNTKLENNKPISQIIAPGGAISYSHGSEERSPYKVSCNIHPWMGAWILARNNGYFFVTGSDGKKDGSFALPNLPAGVPLTMKVWHEKIGFLEDVQVNGAAGGWSKKGAPLTLQPGEEVTWNVEVAQGPFVK